MIIARYIEKILAKKVVFENRGRFITKRVSFCYYKSRQPLQIGAAHFITNRGKFITN